MAFSFLGAFVGMSLIGLLHSYLLKTTQLPLLVGSFGAMSVILFSGFKTPVAQPKNVILGHLALPLAFPQLFREKNIAVQ